MCIILAKPSGIKLPPNTYKNCIDEHDDGVGYAYVKDNQLIVNKGLWDLETFFNEIAPIEESNQMLIHFRRASPGMDTTLENCHPFFFDSGDTWGMPDKSPRFQFAVVHNGRLDYKSTKEVSDTRHYVGEILRPALSQNPFCLEFDFWRDILTRSMNFGINTNNKIAIMRLDRKTEKSGIWILNDKAGEWEGQTWYSNTSYKWPKYVPGEFMGHGYGEGYGYEGMGSYAKNLRQRQYLRQPQSAEVKREREQLHLIGLLREKYKAYATPDTNGWAWDFTIHEFRHTITNMTQPNLGYRQPPYNIEEYREFLAFFPKKSVGPDLPNLQIVTTPQQQQPTSSHTVIPINIVDGADSKIVVPRDAGVGKAVAKWNKHEKQIINTGARRLFGLLGCRELLATLSIDEKMEMICDQYKSLYDMYRDLPDEDIHQAIVESIRTEDANWKMVLASAATAEFPEKN